MYFVVICKHRFKESPGQVGEGSDRSAEERRQHSPERHPPPPNGAEECFELLPTLIAADLRPDTVVHPGPPEPQWYLPEHLLTSCLQETATGAGPGGGGIHEAVRVPLRRV